MEETLLTPEQNRPGRAKKTIGIFIRFTHRPSPEYGGKQVQSAFITSRMRNLGVFFTCQGGFFLLLSGFLKNGKMRSDCRMPFHVPYSQPPDSSTRIVVFRATGEIIVARIVVLSTRVFVLSTRVVDLSTRVVDLSTK